MTTTYFVAMGKSTTSILNDTGTGIRQVAKVEGDLGFVPVVGMLLSFPKSKKPAEIFKIQSDTGDGPEDVRIIRMVKTRATGPNVQTVN
jgi:hypothetical protein